MLEEYEIAHIEENDTHHHDWEHVTMDDATRNFCKAVMAKYAESRAEVLWLLAKKIKLQASLTPAEISELYNERLSTNHWTPPKSEMLDLQKKVAKNCLSDAKVRTMGFEYTAWWRRVPTDQADTRSPQLVFTVTLKMKKPGGGENEAHVINISDDKCPVNGKFVGSDNHNDADTSDDKSLAGTATPGTPDENMSTSFDDLYQQLQELTCGSTQGDGDRDVTGSVPSRADTERQEVGTPSSSTASEASGDVLQPTQRSKRSSFKRNLGEDNPQGTKASRRKVLGTKGHVNRRRT